MNKIRSWLDNFWYHYKWHCIVGLFIIVFLVVSIGQMANKEKVDAYIMYAGPTAFTASEIYEMQDAFESVMPDLNGDGKKIAQFIDITVLTDAQIEENRKKAEAEGLEYKPDMEYIANARQKFKLQLAAGDAYLLLLDPQMYAQDYEIGMYMKLEELGITSEHAYDDSSIKFKETDYGKFLPVFEKLPDDTLLCFRMMNVTAQARGEKEQKKYDDQLTLMKNMLDFSMSPAVGGKTE